MGPITPTGVMWEVGRRRAERAGDQGLAVTTTAQPSSRAERSSSSHPRDNGSHAAAPFAAHCTRKRRRGLHVPPLFTAFLQARRLERQVLVGELAEHPRD